MRMGMKWLKKLRTKGMRKAMLRCGAIEIPCPHCGEPTPVYKDGATTCLICGDNIGESYPRSARRINNKIQFEIGDLRPNEHVCIPILRIERGRKQSKSKFSRGGESLG